MFVKPSPEEDASNPFAEMTNDIAAPISGTVAPLPGSGDDLDELLTYHQAPEITMNTPGSAVVVGLRGGEDLKVLDKSAPADTYRDFTEAFISGLSASMGMPGEVLMQRFGNSYSASRALLVMFWRIVELERAELASDYMDPIYESWLEGEIAAGRVSAPGWSDPRMRQAWLANNWIGDPMPNIDPMRTAAADRLYVEMGAQTINRVARNLNGTEAKSNMAILEKEFEMLPEAPWLNGGNGDAEDEGGGQNNPDNDDDPDEKDDKDG
jgi:capsid protein